MIANLESSAPVSRTRATAPRKTAATAPKAASAIHTLRPVQKTCKGVAKLIGGVAALLVILSVWHLTCATATLTGSPIVLAFLLAVGIDLGLISAELAELVAHGNKIVAKWARGYMTLATILSMVLNAYEFSAHAPQTALSQGIAIAFGLLLPVMIFVLARIAAHLYQTR